MTLRRCALGVAVVFLAGCAPSKQSLPEPELREAVLPGLEDCRGLFAETDARVVEAGVEHEGYHRVPGFPYLRTDRTLASFAHDVQSDEAVGTWVRRMRAHDAEAREYELQNLGLENPERRNLHTDLYRCGRGLAFIDLEVPGNLDLLREHAARIASGPPPAGAAERLVATLRAPLSYFRDERRRTELPETFEKPLADAKAEVIWEAESTRQRALVPMRLDALRSDALGYPGMIASAWRALAEKHAPELWMPDGMNAPAALAWDEQQRLRTRTEVPTVYYRVDFLRDEHRLLPQLHYLVVLPQSGAAQPDVLQWWVTLGPDVEALAYESLASDGMALRFPDNSSENDRLSKSSGDALTLAPQKQPGWPALLRLSAHEPYLSGVLDRELADPSRVRAYRLQAMEQLFQLPLPQGGSRSAIAHDAGLPMALVREP